MRDHPALSRFKGTRLAITGGIAEGKSTVVGILREHGANCVSADEIARDVLLEVNIQTKVAMALGMALPLDRAELRDRISQNGFDRRLVNRILHPEVMCRIFESQARVVEIPLLFEGCVQNLFNKVWVVTCGPEEQLARLVARLGDSNLANSLIGTQLSTEIKLAFADQVVRTNCQLSNVQRQVVFLGQAYGLFE